MLYHFVHRLLLTLKPYSDFSPHPYSNNSFPSMFVYLLLLPLPTSTHKTLNLTHPSFLLSLPQLLYVLLPLYSTPNFPSTLFAHEYTFRLVAHTSLTGTLLAYSLLPFTMGSHVDIITGFHVNPFRVHYHEPPHGHYSVDINAYANIITDPFT